MRAWVLALCGASALALAACSKEEERTGPMSESEVKSAIADAPELSPGRYSATMEVTKFEIPGIPAEQISAMREQMQQSMAVAREYCLTAEDASKGREDMMRRLSQAQGNCQFEDFNVDGDNVSGRLNCSAMPGGGTMTMTMQGTMASDRTDMTMNTRMTNPAAPQQSAEMGMRIKTQRLGACTGNEPPAAGSTPGAPAAPAAPAAPRP